MTTLPGPRMRAIAAYVAGHPGCNKLEAGRCGTTELPRAGSVEALIRGGYMRTEQDHPTSRYRLFLTEAGRGLASGPLREVPGRG